MSTDTTTRLGQPYHFTVKTYAAKEGRVPFTIELSVHLADNDVDQILNENGAIKQGLAKIIKLYEDLGYTHAVK